MGGEWPVYQPGDAVCDALFRGNAAKRNQMKEYREGPIETFPGILSNDPRLLKFKADLSVLATKKFPETLDSQGRVMGNGVRSNFYGLRHVNGFPMGPATWPLVDNSFLREKNGLANKFTKAWHETVLRALVELFFTDLEPVPLKLNKASSSMIPHYTKDMTEKQGIVLRSLAHGREAGELMLKGDYENAFLGYGVGGAYHTVYRRQSSDAISFEDGVFVPKPRPVASLEYALSGGREGSFNPASKSFEDLPPQGDKFPIPGGFFRERNRTAKGGPLGMAGTLMPVAQAVRKAIYRKYAYTYHHTTRASIQEDVRKYDYAIASDVSNHDIFWPHFTLDTIADQLKKIGYSEWWTELYLTKSRLPDYVTDVSPTEGRKLLGDWRHPSSSGGLPSGNPFTDLEGTIVMTWVYFMIQVEHTYPELIPMLQTRTGALTALTRYLKGELPIRLKDKSDDAVLGWSGRAFVSKAKRLHAAMTAGDPVSDYMLVTDERGGAFLGSIFLYPSAGDAGGVVLIGNIISYLVNMFSPEYGVQSGVRDRSKVKRPFGGLAWSTMAQNYGSSPIYSEVKDMVEFVWGKCFASSYSFFREEWLRADQLALREQLERVSNSALPDLSLTDIEVLSDPSRLDWKYDREDVNPAILDALFNGVGLTHVQPFFESVFK